MSLSTLKPIYGTFLDNIGAYIARTRAQGIALSEQKGGPAAEGGGGGGNEGPPFCTPSLPAKQPQFNTRLRRAAAVIIWRLNFRRASKSVYDRRIIDIFIGTIYR